MSNNNIKQIFHSVYLMQAKSNQRAEVIELESQVMSAIRCNSQLQFKIAKHEIENSKNLTTETKSKLLDAISIYLQ